MKSFLLTLLVIPLGLTNANDDYTFFVRQVQMPTGAGGSEVEWDVPVAQEGSDQSPLEVNPNGARFELHTVKAQPLTSYLLDTTYVNSYIPVAEMEIVTEDPYSVIPRTRADRGFTVKITVNGLSTDPAAQEAAKTIKLLRHTQAYAANGTGEDVNRSQARLESQGSLTANGVHTFDYAISSIQNGDRTKVRGEERFSAFSLEDYQAPESQLDSVFVQIWPMAEATIIGLENDALIKGSAPDLSIDLVDLYPESYTYVKAYKGPYDATAVGTVIPGSAKVFSGSVPQNERLEVRSWDEVIPDDGVWTIEVVTETPFDDGGYLGHRTFNVSRSITVKGGITSVE